MRDATTERQVLSGPRPAHGRILSVALHSGENHSTVICSEVKAAAALGSRNIWSPVGIELTAARIGAVAYVESKLIRHRLVSCPSIAHVSS